MPGLGSRLGRGGATTPQESLADSDCIVIMGSNMAESHPVAFRFVMKAKQAGATIIHIDPRFSRTSALADMHVPIRPGTDLVFLGGLVNYVLEHDKWFHEYVRHYTNAPVIIREDFEDTEDLGGVFSGYDPATRKYDKQTWQYAGQNIPPDFEEAHEGQTAEPREGFTGRLDSPPPVDPTLQHPRCVFQIIKRHYARYTPDMVERTCGMPADLFLKVAEAVTANSGRERTTAFCYSVAWTQHTTGTQTISACALLQLLLGNIGRPGGGILALRGHATIQGSTDIPTLYNLLPGYIPMPSATQQHSTLAGFLAYETPPTGWMHNTPAYMISLLKAWYGDNATPENDFCYDLIPKIDADYSFQAMLTLMKDGIMRGLFCIGQNPAVGGQNAVLAREGLANLDWLVVRDAHEIESAAFWHDSPEVREGKLKTSDIKTEIFLMPASLAGEKDGSFTNTHRLIQWHDRAVDPPGDCRSDIWFVHDIGQRMKKLYAEDDGPTGRQIKALTLDHGPYDALGEPNVTSVLREINGYTVDDNRLVLDFTHLRDDGSTACGCWIYSGVMPAEDNNRARSRRAGAPISLDWGFAWPANRRILYNRASADPDGNPWSERKKWIWWDAEQELWVGYDNVDFPRDKPPSYRPAPGARGIDAHAGDAPFIMMADGRGWLFAASGLHDGPLPTHYEPWETPTPSLLYPQHTRSPVAPFFDRPDNPYHDIRDPRFPHVITTYRLTEHHTAGGMSRWVPWLAELQPQGFVEISPEMAGEIGVNNGDWVTLTTLRGQVEARALVTDRIQPLMIDGRSTHQIGMPWHFGFGGLATGDIANDLASLVEDPNSRIHEAKAFTCNIRAGRLDGGRQETT